jgi:hypothetical protein
MRGARTLAIVAAIERDLIAEYTQYKVLNGSVILDEVIVAIFIACEAKQSTRSAPKGGLLRRFAPRNDETYPGSS